MNTVICEAIGKRQVLAFRYAGGERIVEPYRHGKSTAGNEVLRAYQLSGYSSSHQPAAWKLFDIYKMADVHPTGQTFRFNRAGYVAKDRTMRYVHCQVAADPLRTTGSLQRNEQPEGKNLHHDRR